MSTSPLPDGATAERSADWQRRVVDRSLRSARARSIDRGSTLIRAATALIERSGRDSFTVQEVADEAGQSLRTLYQYFESKDDLLLAVYEEAMRTYAHRIRTAIQDLDDPLDRLAGALVTIARLPESTVPGVTGGLTRLRLKLAEVEPELVGRARLPIGTVLRDLVREAIDAGELSVRDPEGAAYLLFTSNTAPITASALGNDVGVDPPDAEELVGFCLRGVGATMGPGWYASISRRLRLPTTTFDPAARARD